MSSNTGAITESRTDHEKSGVQRVTRFFRKYFCYGQFKKGKIASDGSTQVRPPPPPGSSWFYRTFIYKRPHHVVVLLPFLLVWATYLPVMSIMEYWPLVFDAPEPAVNGWKLTLMMFFGSFIAGCTSEGGGSVAFPIMTLVMGLDSIVARDFSLMIQSIGMTAAMFSILYSGILYEKWAVLWGTVGGTLGMIIGLQFVVEHIPSNISKLFFVGVFLAFAIALFVLNLERKRPTQLKIPNRDRQSASLLVCVGFVGGLVGSVAGSGLDICTFTLLVLYYRLNEKTATPTSVVLMSINTCVGFFWRGVAQGAMDAGIPSQTYYYWLAAVPIVPIGAPLGAFVSSFLHRHVLACFIYFTDVSQFIAAYIILGFTKELTPAAVGLGLGALAFFLFVFFGMSFLGKRHHLPLASASVGVADIPVLDLDEGTRVASGYDGPPALFVAEGGAFEDSRVATLVGLNAESVSLPVATSEAVPALSEFNMAGSERQMESASTSTVDSQSSSTGANSGVFVLPARKNHADSDESDSDRVVYGSTSDAV
eukprot:TRINITY_DN4214_c0_g1_i1.p1 TRINITY_DN4214_c0_g1~~TRINITY_DN4214_c0_g1_i1.p1  ORF type:complete len:561 (-),score=47.55 TRINITY_DN4214_c0_g1_i1:28-1638(-)